MNVVSLPSFSIINRIYRNDFEFVRCASFFYSQKPFFSLISSKSIRILKARVIKNRKEKIIWFLCSESPYHLIFLKKGLFFPLQLQT